MRKVLWCCAAAGAAVCCAFCAVAYVSRNPESPVSRYAVATVEKVGAAPVHSTQVAVVEADDLIPPDPVPVENLPLLPVPGSHVPPAVAALMAPPPIIIHDEEEPIGPIAKAQPTVSGHADVDALPPATYDIHISQKRDAGPPAMPYCSEEDSTAPKMPYCSDDAPEPSTDKDMSQAAPAAYREFDTFAFWMGFFSGPSHVLSDPSGAKWQEDAHYPQQYSGLPFTIRQVSAEEPAKAETKAPPAFPGIEESTETPPANDAAPHNVSSRPRHLQMKRMVEPASDTMEVRPSDWKPAHLEPGPF